MGRRLAAFWPMLIVCAALGLLASAFLYGTPRDEEEFRFAVLSAWLRVRAFADGQYPFWVSRMGLGVPQPFVPHFGFHPLLPLLAVLSPVMWVRLLLLAHSIAGAVGMWLVCRRLQLAGVVAAACTVTYLLAAPVQNYVLSDFWLSHFLVWTSLPWILLLTWGILERGSRRSWRAGLALGLLTGVTLANTNPGHAAVYFPLAFGIAATNGREIRRQWQALSLAAIVVAAVSAPNLVHLTSERQLFPQRFALSNEPAPLLIRAAFDDLWRPFGTFEGTRTLFLGAPFSILAVAGCVWLAPVRTDLVIASVIAAVMLFTQWLPIPWVSARYQFRDPLTLCAVLLAGCVANRLLSRQGMRPVAAIALLLQLAVIPAAAWPLIHESWEPEGLRAAAFRGATGDALTSDAVIAAMRTRGRLLYSPRVEHAVAERMLVDDGLGINALAYRDVPVVNGSFKAVSTDPLWPSDRLFYSWIRTPQALVDSDSSLDVLGVRYVLSIRGEHVAAGLREIWSGTALRGDELVLWENEDAGPGAVLLDPTLIAQPLPAYAACGHDRLLCRDVGVLNVLRDGDVATIDRDVNEMRITWQPVAHPRTLVVTEMYRPAWTAASGNTSLETRSVYGGFIGVHLPAGVSSVHFRYRPTAIIAATLVCYSALTLALAALAVTAGRAAHPDRRTDPVI